MTGGLGAVFTGGGNTTGGTGFARLTAARWGVIPVCCCSLRGGYGAFGVFLDEEILVDWECLLLQWQGRG